MIRQQLASAIELLDRIEERLHHLSSGSIRSLIPNLSVHLRQTRSAQPKFALTKINQDQRSIAFAQLRRQRPAHITHRRKTRHDQRQRRHHGLRLVALTPLRLHRHRVFAHRNRHPQRRAKLHPHRVHCVEELLILLPLTRSRHPVRRELNVTKRPNSLQPDRRARHIGDDLTHGHARRGRRIDHRQRRPLTDGHRLAPDRLIRTQCHRAVGDRHLPRPNHLVLHHHPRNAAIANRNQERLRRNRRQPQQPLHCICNRYTRKIQRRRSNLRPRKRALHLRRFTK